MQTVRLKALLYSVHTFPPDRSKEKNLHSEFEMSYLTFFYLNT